MPENCESSPGPPDQPDQPGALAEGREVAVCDPGGSATDWIAGPDELPEATLGAVDDQTLTAADSSGPATATVPTPTPTPTTTPPPTTPGAGEPAAPLPASFGRYRVRRLLARGGVRPGYLVTESSAAAM